jgi:hypothetical protein
MFTTTRDGKRKFEDLEGLSVFKDLYGHPVMRRDGVHVDVVLSPHMVVFELSHQVETGWSPYPYNRS